MRRTFLTILTLGLLTGPLRAQAPGEVASMLAWRDSLQAMSDSELHQLVASTRGARSPEERLRYGWVLLATGERSDSALPFTRAADQFYEVTVRRPRWVLGWYGLGVAKHRLADLGAREVRSPHQGAGTGWITAGVQAYLAALKVDSTFAPAIRAVAELAPRLTSRPQFDATWEVVRAAAIADSSSPGVWLLLASGATFQGDDASALSALDRGKDLPDAPHGAFLLERARTLFALGRPEEAESTYYAGATEPDSLGIGRYRQDVAYVADSAELAGWDATQVPEREERLRAFWGDRERASGRPAGSRLIEHNRRRRYALQHFSPLPAWKRQYEFNMEHRDTLADLDDRGMVYIRHGEPDMTAGAIVDVYPNVSWLYFRPEGNLLFHFVSSPFSSGWHLTTSLTDMAPPGEFLPSEVFASRMGLDPRYGTLALRIQQDSMMIMSGRRVGLAGGVSSYQPRAADFRIIIDRERVQRRADMTRGLSTDSDPLRFDRELEPIVQVFGIGGRDAATGGLLVAMSVPATDRLESIPLPDGGVGYVVRLRVTAADDSGRTTLDVDSLIRLRLLRPLAKGQHLTFVRSYELPATGDQRVRLILTDSARSFGAVRVVNGVPLPALQTDRLVITDLVVGKNGSGSTWRRPDGTTIALNPLNAWTPAEALEVGFELSGLETAVPYKVKIAIADLEADSTKPPRASVEFENQASGTRELVTQSLGLRTLRPGRYLLTVTVTAGDRSIRRERRITIARGR
jgi:hypothetical protein